MLRLTVLLLISTFCLAGCAPQAANQSANGPRPGMGILGSLRPKVDPAVVERMHEEEAAKLAKQKALEAASQKGENEISADGLGRILPKVSTDPIAPPAEDVAQQNGPIFTPAQQQFTPPNMMGGMPTAPQQAAPQQVAATYGGTVPPPPAASLGGGLIPPPPAVTLSTAATIPAGIPDPGMYANPYMNPYGMPYPFPQQQMMPPQMMQQMPQQPMGRPSGSPFGAGGGSRAGDEDDSAPEKKKNANFQPINPTGMESRSAYKQRDDLKALWNGVLKTNAMSLLMKDDKFSSQLNHVDIGLPTESTKGTLATSQRQVDSVFKNASLDRRILTPVRKLQGDMVQAYYRYLYSFNKFALAQQTVQARKQEAEVAGSASEQQRAAADLSQAQNDAESAKDDMKSAQNELSLIAGPQAARYIIGKVSGVAPSSDSLAQAEAPAPQSSGGLLGLFHLGGGSSKKSQPQPQAESGSSGDETTVANLPSDKKQKEPKGKKSHKKGKDGQESSEKTADLTPAPEPTQEAPAVASSPAGGGQQGISFELKNVNVTARKSILTVSIHNSSANNFSFSPDVISIAEGNHKLSEAAVRADFDQTMVAPNQEVKGTITIFGRPWNDRLAVSLSDGGKTIQMSRR